MKLWRFISCVTFTRYSCVRTYTTAMIDSQGQSASKILDKAIPVTHRHAMTGIDILLGKATLVTSRHAMTGVDS